MIRHERSLPRRRILQAAVAGGAALVADWAAGAESQPGGTAVQDALEQGATHIHVHFSSTGQAARCSEEHDLVMFWRPACNEAVEEG